MLPAHHPLFIDDVGGGVGPTLAVGIENTVAVYDLVVLVIQHRKIDQSGGSLIQLLDKLLGFLVAVDADRQDLRLFFLSFD